MHLVLIYLLFLFVGCGGSSDIKQIEDDWYRPTINTTWQWQLKGKINQNYAVDLYDIDLFDTNVSVIDYLKSSGKKVICYFSAGSFESWRKDASSFSKELLGKSLDGWADEQWLDISSDKLHSIMRARLDLAKQKGCDGVEPDNIDGYSNDTGFNLTYKDQLNYNRFLADEAHKRGLSIGLKNDLDQVKELEPFFDFALNEQCHEFDECDKLKPFIEAYKPVFNAEYDRTKKDEFCANSLLEGFQTLILPLALDDSFRFTCD